jgi:hypothetical protein
MSPDRNNLFGPEDRRMFRNWSIFAVIALGVLLFIAFVMGGFSML